MRKLNQFGTCAALTAAFAISIGAGTAAAQDGAPPPPAPNSAPNTASDSMPPNQAPETTANQPMRRNARAAAEPKSDADFAREASQGGEAEVKLGQLAMQNGQSDAVKNFGKKMMDDHIKAGENLKAAATKSDIDLPAGLSPKDQATYDQLSKLNGSAFDHAYARSMTRDHVQDIAAFRQESANGTDPNIKQFATATLPILQDHLRDARAMEQAVGVQPHNGNRRAAATGSNGDGSPASQPAPQQ
jgi:putative membrane protein